MSAERQGCVLLLDERSIGTLRDAANVLRDAAIEAESNLDRDEWLRVADELDRMWDEAERTSR